MKTPSSAPITDPARRIEDRHPQPPRPDIGRSRICAGPIVILGPGLLGGSLAMALRQASPADTITLWARRDDAVAETRARHIAHVATTDLQEATRDAALVILCTPVGAMTDLARRIAGSLPPGAPVTDVGSVKGAITPELESILQPANPFVGAHPMAGSERSGTRAARADLFRGATCFLTPTPATDPDALERVANLWRAVGCHLHHISPDEHDTIVATISHLPHLVASVLADHAASRLPADFKLCGNGFRDITRVAAASPDLWTEILRLNRRHLLESLDGLLDRLDILRAELAAASPDALRQRLTRARDARISLDQTH